METRVLLSFIYLFIITIKDAYTQKEDFFISPENILLYYDSRNYIHILCAPKDFNANVQWIRNERPVQTNERISTINNTADHHWQYPQLENTTIVYELIIDPVLTKDVGEYMCRSRSTFSESQVAFTINITDECRDNTFKCTGEKKCILESVVCDGRPHCNDQSEEKLQAGCMLPIPPKIISIKKGATYLTIHWKEVENAYKYIIDVRSNKSLELVNTKYTSITLNQLTPNTTYYIAIQSISFAGESNFTLTKSVTTTTGNPPSAPKGTRSHHRTIYSISYVWNKVEEATSYEVQIKHPDGDITKIIAFPNLLEVLLEKLESGKAYIFQVRAKSKFGYSNYSKPLTIDTLKVGKPGPPSNVTVEVHGQDALFAWLPPDRIGNTQPYHLTYLLHFCMQEEFTNKVTNTTDYLLVQCKQTKTMGETTLNLTDLKPYTTYGYNLTTFGLEVTKGDTTRGNFTTTMYTTVSPSTEYNPYFQAETQFSGIVIFAIVSGALVALLILAFIFAYLCKWKVLMDAMDEYNVKQVKQDETKSNLSRKSDVLLENYDKF